MSFDAPPQDLLLDVRNWLADASYPDGGVYPNYLGEPFDARAAAVWIDDVYVRLWQTVGPHDQPLVKHQNIKAEIFRQIKAVHEATPPAPPRPVDPGVVTPGRPLRKLEGRIELIDGGRGGIRDRVGRFVGVGVHAGDLVSRFHRDRVFAEAQLDHVEAAGGQFVRSWFDLPGDWWAARTGNFTPSMTGYKDTVRYYCDALVKRGLRLQASMGDAARDFPDRDRRREFMAMLAGLFQQCGGAEHLLISVDAGNEAWQNGEEDPLKLADMLAAFLAVCPVPLAALTSARDEGALNEYAVDPATVIAYHTSRFPFRRATERGWTAGYWDGKLRAFLLSDEPFGVNLADGIDRPGAHVSATAHPEEWRDLETIGMGYVPMMMTPQLLTVMTSPGVISDEPFERYAAIAHTMKLAATLPQDVQSWKHFHGGEGRVFSSERVLAVSGDNTRCEHALNTQTGDVVVAVYADEPGHFEFQAVHGFEGEIINPGTLERFPLRFAANARVALDFRRGRYLIGKRTS